MINQDNTQDNTFPDFASDSFGFLAICVFCFLPGLSVFCLPSQTAYSDCGYCSALPAPPPPPPPCIKTVTFNSV